MTTDEAILWRQFIILHGKEFDRFDYDLPVGKGVDPGESVSEYLRKDYIDLTRKRIDAVGYKNNTATLFEVKPRAATTALGQLLTYANLFVQTYPGVPIVGSAVVTSLINDDERQVYESMKIKIFVYPIL